MRSARTSYVSRNSFDRRPAEQQVHPPTVTERPYSSPSPVSRAEGSLALLGVRHPLAWTLAVLALLSSAVGLTFGGSIRDNWLKRQWEDPLFFEHVDRNVRTVWDAFEVGSYWRGLYRPLSTNLIYFAGERLAQHDPRFYHALSLGFYVLNGLLSYLLLRRIAGAFAALIAAMLFVTRLAHTEALLYSSQLQTLLPTTFGLLALASYAAGYQRRSASLYVGSAAAVFLALLSKESAVVVPICCLLFVLLIARPAPLSLRRDGPWMLAPFVAVAAWLPLGLPHLEIAHNPWWQYDFSLPYWLSTYALYAAAFSNHLVAPIKLVAPAIIMSGYPWFSAVAQSAWTVPVTAAAFLLSSAIVCVRLGGGRLRARLEAMGWVGRVAGSRLIVVSSVSVLLFFVSLAPVVPLSGRILNYYAYAGHLWLGLACGAAAAAALSWSVALIDRVASARRR